MRSQFTPFQIVLTSLSAVAFTFCIVGDIFVLLFGRGTVSEKALITNLVLSAVAMAVSMLLIFKADSFDTFGRNAGEDEDKLPAVCALRTYFCMLACDFGGVLCIMLAGALFYENAGKAILIFAPSLFVLAAAVYFVRVSRIGLDDFSDSDDDDPFDGDFQ